MRKLIYNLRQFLYPQDYVTNKTRLKYYDYNINPPESATFDEKSSKYKGSDELNER